MGTIYRFRNIRLVVYPNDHGPPHVHAISPKGEAKISIQDLECFFSRGYSRRDLRMIIKFIASKRATFLEAWYENQK